MERVFHQELPDTGEFSNKLQQATAQVPLVVIKDMESRQKAEELLKVLKQMREHPQIKQIEELKKEAYSHWKNISTLLKSIVDPIDKAISAMKAKILAFDQQERKRREEEAAKLREEIKRREIEAAIESGDLERARQLNNGEISVPGVQVEAGPIGRNTYHRGQWVAEITDPKAVLEEVLAGKVRLEDVIEIKLPYFNRLARRMKAENLGIRGVRGVYKETLVSR